MRKALALRLVMFIMVIATFLCLPLRPLWVDEIYQLEATRDLPVGQVLHSSMVAPGGMPLGYLAQTFWLRAVGFSRAKARVPAALFGLGTVFVTAWIARQLSLNESLTIILGLITPILFRYSTEARPYSQGLFFSALSTALLLCWLRNPSRTKWAAYALCLVAGIYSQPFALFTAVAHASYLFLKDRKRVPAVCLAILIAGVAYLPWFLLSQQALKFEVWPHVMFFSWHQISPFMILKEISGGGYICSIPLLLLILAGFSRRTYPLFLCWLFIPMTLAILADAKFNYFFAIRQLIFVVPPILLLTVSATEQLWNRRKLAVELLLGVFFVGAIVKNVNWERDRKEDWGKAAAAIKIRLLESHGCVSFEPSGDSLHYYFYDSWLSSHTCEKRARQYHELVAYSPYAPAAERRAAPNAVNVGNTVLSSSTN